MNMRTLSLAALTLLDVPPPEQVRIAARTGFTHVGLRLLPATPADPDYDILGDTPAVRATLSALMETGIRVSDVEIVRLTPGFTLDDRLQRFMETAARLGAGQVLVAGNDDNLQRSADNLAILAAAGRPYGLTMNLEPMPWTQLRTIADAQAMIAASGREDIGILVDALHFWRAGESLAALSSLPAHHLNYMQLCDGAAQRPESEQELIRQARSAQRARGRRSGSARSNVGPARNAAGLPRSAARRRAGRLAAAPAGAITVQCRAALPALLRIRNTL